jgi:hypothetical protein
MLVEGVILFVDELFAIHEKRRNPIRIALVRLPLKLDKPYLISLGSDGGDGNLRDIRAFQKSETEQQQNEEGSISGNRVNFQDEED